MIVYVKLRIFMIQANGNIIRHCIHNLEKMGLVEEAENGYCIFLQLTCSGRKLTSEGQRQLNQVAKKL